MTLHKEFNNWKIMNNASVLNKIHCKAINSKNHKYFSSVRVNYLYVWFIQNAWHTILN